MSMNRIQTFSFGVMQSLSMFTIFDSRTPRSTTRASSIASGRGGPASKVGLAIGINSTLVDGHLDADEDVRVPQLHAGAPFGGLDERTVDRHRAGLIEAAAVDPLPGRREAVHVSAHQLRHDLLAHQIPSGPKSSSGGGDGSSGSTGAAAGGDSFRMSSRVTEYRRRSASRCCS